MQHPAGMPSMRRIGSPVYELQSSPSQSGAIGLTHAQGHDSQFELFNLEPFDSSHGMGFNAGAGNSR